MKPWDHDPVLIEDRLIEIGRLITAGRNHALDRYDPSVGCDAWTVGCEAFKFQCFQIETASYDLPWLEVLNSSMEFVFSIGGVGMRFYRGEPSEPHERTLRQSFSELAQMSLFAEEELAKSGQTILYRFAVETDIDGSITQISFVVLSEGQPLIIWPIPLDQPVIGIAPIRPERAEGVVLPFPKVSPKKGDTKKKTQD